MEMTETISPKHMTGALLSGVIDFDEQGNLIRITWCLTPDGETAPADIQPVIRMSSLAETGEVLQAMLSELQDRFAQAAAAAAAKALKSKLKQPVTAPPAGSPIPKSVPDARNEEVDGADQEDAESDGGQTSLDKEEIQTGEEFSPEEGNQPEPFPTPVLVVKKPELAKVFPKKEAPAFPSLFDGLDLS
jgi:hypothetical protein